MIESITIEKFKKAKRGSAEQNRLFGYAENLPFFQELTKKRSAAVQFKPGLNILFGPNGSGKSTLLSMLALYLAAEQGGVSTVTQDWISKVFGFRSNDLNFHYHLAHDGQPILYGNPRQTVGLSGGSFDDDFFSEGLINTFNRGSTGETTLFRLREILEVLSGKKPPPATISMRLQRNRLNDVWAARLDLIEKAVLKPTLPKGTFTVLIDEPESGLGLPWQAGLWRNILGHPKTAEHFQLIVATHSPFALGLDHAHYINLQAGYREECEQALAKWLNECSSALTS